MKQRVTISIAAVLLLGLMLALALLSAPASDARPTNYDGIHVSCPDCTTATPALRANQESGSTGKIIEAADADTVIFSVNDGGASSFAAPTAIATAAPALVVDSAGVSNILEVRDAATPVFTVNDGGSVGGFTQDLGTENIGILPSVCTASITYTAAAGGSGTVCTVGASEVWLVHAVYVNVTTDFDATGDDATLDIGDGNDADGLLVLIDAELQAADTEGTGAAAGWQGFMSTDTIGAYLAQGLGFIYSGSETIDYLIDETSGETLTAGAATIYVVYTRIQ